MHDAGRMRLIQAVQELQGMVHRFLPGQRTALEALGKGLAGAERHGNEHEAVRRLVDFVHGTDGRVIQGGGGPGLLEQMTPALAVASQRGREQLEGNRSLQAGVEGPIDHPHSPRSDALLQFVAPDAGSRLGTGRGGRR